MTRRTSLFAALAMLALGLPALGQTPSKRVRGTVQSLEGQILTVLANDGETVKISLGPNYTVGAIVPATLEALKPGAMVGIVGFGPPKQQRAAVISIFPPGGTANELQIPWDSQPDSVMTNAPVVSEVQGTNGRVLNVTVKGEPVEVTVPPNVVVQTSEPGSPAMLVPGAHVMIFAQQTPAGLTAPRVSVGKDGWTPAN